MSEGREGDAGRAAAAAPAGVRTATLRADDGARLAYDDAGAGRAVVLVHGFPQSRRYWHPQLAALPAGVRALAPDLRGFGDSEPRAPLSLDRHADDLVALLDHVGVARAVVCGLSMGGYVALALWRRHPARVRALVLADTRAGADDAAGRARRDALVALARREGSAAVADTQLAGSLGRTTREREPARVAAFRALLSAAPVEGIVGALLAMRDRPDATATLPTIAVPTLVLVGAEDVLTPVDEARRLAAGIVGARLAVIDGAGHASSWERPAAFTAELAAFVLALPPSPDDG